jgi:hypothetical protein
MNSPSTTPPQAGGADRRFAFRFDRAARLLLAPLAVTPATSEVRVGRHDLRIRYGPWRLRIDRAHIRAARVTGPFRWWKAIGPHLSLADHGLTLGTTTHGGVCLELARPVAWLAPRGLLDHPAVTLTVDRPAELARLLRPRLVRRLARRAGWPW